MGLNQEQSVLPTGHPDARPKWDWSLGLICWVDFETTGLLREGAPRPALLEAGVVLTTSDLTVLDKKSVLVMHEDLDPTEYTIDKAAMAMHKHSGLLDEVLGNKPPRRGSVLAECEEDAESDLCDFLRDHGVGPGAHPERPLIWGGFSPGSLDRPLAKVLLPAFFDCFHHRTIDLSSVRLVMKNWAGYDPIGDHGPKAHRALLDCMVTVRLAKHYAQYLRPK